MKYYDNIYIYIHTYIHTYIHINMVAWIYHHFNKSVHFSYKKHVGKTWKNYDPSMMFPFFAVAMFPGALAIPQPTPGPLPAVGTGESQ